MLGVWGYLSLHTLFLPIQSDTFGFCIIWCSLTDEKNRGRKELLTFFSRWFYWEGNHVNCYYSYFSWLRQLLLNLSFLMMQNQSALWWTFLVFIDLFTCTIWAYFVHLKMFTHYISQPLTALVSVFVLRFVRSQHWILGACISTAKYERSPFFSFFLETVLIIFRLFSLRFKRNRKEVKILKLV